MKTNYAELHSLRGIAALIVVSTHFLIVFPQFYSGVSLHSGWLPVLVKYTPLHVLIGGHGSVVLFFALSGFVLAQAFLGGKKVPYGTYLIRRLLRILPAYWVSVFGACAMASLWPVFNDMRFSDWFHDVANQAPPTLDVVLSHVLLIGQFDTARINPVVWSLVFEMRISIIFPLLVACAARWPAKVVFPVSLLAVPLSVLLQRYSMTLAATLEYVPVFLFGILLAMNLPALSSWFLARSRLFQVGTALGAFLAIYYLRSNAATPVWIGSSIECFQGFASAALMLAAICSIRTGRVLKHAVARFFGDISYSLYLWHVPVLVATVKRLASALPIPAVLLIALVLSVFAAMLSFYLIERPFMALAKAITAKKREKKPAADVLTASPDAKSARQVASKTAA